jgi:hypothetical protein
MSRTARRRSSVRAALAIVAPWSGPRFEHHVKGRFGGATEPGEAAGAHHLPQFDLTRLRPETKPNLLRQRRGRADHGGGCVIHPSDGIEVFCKMIVRERLHDHPGAVRLQRLAHVRRRADRVPHVMQTVEERDEIVTPGIGLGLRHLEAGVGSDAGVRGRLARAINRSPVIVETGKMRFAEPHTQAATKAARPAVRQNKYKVGNAAIERIATGFRWAEGPVYIRDYRRLIWSDIPNNRMMSWNEEDGHVSVFRQPSNYTNGNTRDRQGRLLSCEHDARRVSRTEHDGTITTIIDSFDGKKLNAPNDVVVAADDSIWFTDPGYGIFGNYEGHLDKSEQPPRVYRVDGKTGKATIVIDSLLGERASKALDWQIHTGALTQFLLQHFLWPLR